MTTLIDLLLIEDSPGDVELVRQGLKRSTLLNELHVVTDGVEALKFLRTEGEYEGKPRPDLVLLDINLPRMNGLEVLANIRKDPKLRTIPVVILTTSDHNNDVLRAYEHSANAYVQKPLQATEFIKVVHEIERFWLSTAKLPPRT